MTSQKDELGTSQNVNACGEVRYEERTDNGAETDIMFDKNRSTGRLKGRPCRQTTKLPPLRAVVTVVACIIIEVTASITYTAGNMLPYLTSYLRNRTEDTSLDYSSVVWADNSFWLVTHSVIPFLGLLEQRLPNRLYLLIGIVSFAVSYIGSYWTLQASLPVFVVVFAVGQGVAQGILWPSAVGVALRWFPKNIKLVGAIVISGYGAGGFVWNQVVTHWINPLNLQPDVTVGENVYFTQPEVLDNVRSCYLFLGGVLSGAQLLCLLCIGYPPAPSLVGKSRDCDTHTPLRRDEGEGDTVQADREASACDVTILEPCGDDDRPLTTETCRSTLPDPQQQHDLLKTEGQSGEEPHMTPDYGPISVLKSRVTWSLVDQCGKWHGFYLHLTYGQTFIHDDHFLALAGSFAGIFNAVCRPFWGLLAEKIGYWNCLNFSLGLLTLTTGTFVLCEYAGKVMFFTWVCLMYIALGIYFTFETQMCYALYGPRVYAFSFGVIQTSGVIYHLVSIFVAGATLPVIGWHGIFLLAGALAFVALLISVSIRFDCGFPISDHMKRVLFSRKRTRKAAEEKLTEELS